MCWFHDPNVVVMEDLWHFLLIAKKTCSCCVECVPNWFNKSQKVNNASSHIMHDEGQVSIDVNFLHHLHFLNLRFFPEFCWCIKFDNYETWIWSGHVVMRFRLFSSSFSNSIINRLSNVYLQFWMIQIESFNIDWLLSARWQRRHAVNFDNPLQTIDYVSSLDSKFDEVQSTIWKILVWSGLHLSAKALKCPYNNNPRTNGRWSILVS